jgi:hypothetical protein
MILQTGSIISVKAINYQLLLKFHFLKFKNGLAYRFFSGSAPAKLSNAEIAFLEQTR